jgi:hypothetical protein
MQAILIVGAASSRDHLMSRLEAAPTGFLMVTRAFRISTIHYFNNLCDYHISIAFNPLMQRMSLRATAGSAEI